MESYLLTATECLEKFKDGSLTVEAYARSLLARIDQRDSAVKAWAYLDPEYVMEQARALDQIPPEKRGPLHGVSVAVKDIMHTKRMPTQHNSPIYKGDAPEIDAGSVTILKRAGALLIGKSTTTQFASPKDGPPTCNPNDLSRTPGGSSSGSAAAVADFQVAIGLGTQTGGSTIRPGSFNGIYALKPTWNAITQQGHKTYSLTLDTIGFFARSADDLELLAKVFALEDDAPSEVETTVPIQGAKFAFVRTVVWPEAGPGTLVGMDLAARLLREHGAEVEVVELPPEFDEMPRWHHIIMDTEGRSAFLPEYRISKEQLQPFIADHVENSTEISRAEQLEAFDGVATLRPKFDKIAAKYTAIITPSAIDEAPLGQKFTGSAAFNVIWTALHTPVINVPGFKGENGMPVGLSLVAGRYHDRHLLAVAKEVGKTFESQGGWKRHCYV
uniref:Amidase domain-containing protein n=1 Tax=Bionectria ochroleuca TaxID=29856 RepID=A0A8H7K612_BIOOC